MSSFNATLAAPSLSNVQQTRPEPRSSVPVKPRATDAISMFFPINYASLASSISTKRSSAAT